MEFLVRVVDKVPSDSTASEAGDLISACPDGWLWSTEERTADYWRIISLPALDSDRATLLAGRMNASGKLLKRRDSMVDLSALPLPGRFTGTRQAEIITLTRADVIGAVHKKP